MTLHLRPVYDQFIDEGYMVPNPLKNNGLKAVLTQMKLATSRPKFDELDRVRQVLDGLSGREIAERLRDAANPRRAFNVQLEMDRRVSRAKFDKRSPEKVSGR